MGVALGGGSARGIAHVGVLRWLEEHRIPIDLVSGTSMGGLIGGSYAGGMTPDEIEAMLAGIDWTEMFDASDFQFQNVRRKRDSRAYPSHLEFGVKRGLSAQPSLNSGQQVDLLIARVTAPYYGIKSFDELPTPFRSVAFDLLTAKRVVLDRGSLAVALRATMSLPAVFPPVQVDGKVLVDGGVADNVPADVVHDLGAVHVIAVNVGDLRDKEVEKLSSSLLGIASTTIDAMMRANTLEGLKAADVVVDVPLTEYGSLDWRRYRELIREGYDAAESMKAQLLPFAIGEGEWNAWHDARMRARRSELPAIAFVDVEGAGKSDAAVMRRVLAPLAGRPADLPALEKAITELGGIGRYESLTWQIVERDGRSGLRVHAQPKSYAPPFLYLGVSLENTTSSQFRFGLSGRLLTFDTVGSGSELRIDAAVGSDPQLGIALYRPIGSSPFFVEPFAGVASRTLNLIQDHQIIASYSETGAHIGADAGATIGRFDEVRAGAQWGRLDASVLVGDPGLPDLSGETALVRMLWTHDSQDSAIVPTRGVHSETELKHYTAAPTPEFATTKSTEGVTQLAGAASWFKPLDAGAINRLFASGGAGTSFGDHPLPTEQFALGGPFRLGALDVGEQRGDNFVLATAGYLRQLGRLPDFLGGPLMAGAWLENGSAFDDWDSAKFKTNISIGVIGETLIGPVFLGASFGFDGASRFYIAVGRLFR